MYDPVVCTVKVEGKIIKIIGMQFYLEEYEVKCSMIITVIAVDHYHSHVNYFTWLGTFIILVRT